MIKRTLGTIILLGLFAFMFAQAQDLFFSEIVEGSSNNKAIEIFNGTGAAVDLSGYTIKLGSNGGTWSTTNILTPTGTLANNDVFVIANAGANATILGVSDVQSTVTYYNGDDALGLFHGDTMIDIIGVYQTDPGTAWDVAGVVGATLNHTIVRKPSVISGNLNWAVSAGTNADNSEWIVYEQDFITDLGMHTFEPGGGEQAATPTFNPPGGVYSQGINVTIATTTAGATIRYTTDGSIPSATVGTIYSIPVALNTNTTLKAIAYVNGSTTIDPSYIASGMYVFPTVVSTLAQLRTMTAGTGTVYMVAEELTLSFQQDFRHQKFVQSNSAGILIDDTAGVIATPYNLGDGITGLTGTVARYNNMLQFTPVANPGPATSTGNGLYAPTVTTAAIAANVEMYQARMVRVTAAHLVETGTFASGTNYTLQDASGTIVFRTAFYDADYIGETIPVGDYNFLLIVNQFNQTPQVYARMTADWAPVANDDDIIVPVNTTLKGNYPNPFNPNTTIEFYTAKAVPVQITIYNQKGQIVRDWNLEAKANGNHSVSWDGKDNSGNSVTSGVYYYRMNSGKYSSTRKMVLMK